MTTELCCPSLSGDNMSVWEGYLHSAGGKQKVVGGVWKVDTAERCAWVMSSRRGGLCWLLTVSQPQSHSTFCSVRLLLDCWKLHFPDSLASGLLVKVDLLVGAGWGGLGSERREGSLFYSPKPAISSGHLAPAWTIFAPTFLEVPAPAATNPTLPPSAYQKSKCWSHGDLPCRFLASFQDDPQGSIPVLLLVAVSAPTLNRGCPVWPMEYGGSDAVGSWD